MGGLFLISAGTIPRSSPKIRVCVSICRLSFQGRCLVLRERSRPVVLNVDIILQRRGGRFVRRGRAASQHIPAPERKSSPAEKSFLWWTRDKWRWDGSSRSPSSSSGSPRSTRPTELCRLPRSSGWVSCRRPPPSLLRHILSATCL